MSQFKIHVIHYPCASITSRLHIGEFVEFNSLSQVSLAVIVTALPVFQELEIKKLAKEGNHEGCKILAKQLIQLRKQKTRTYAASSKVWEIVSHSDSYMYLVDWLVYHCNTIFGVVESSVCEMTGMQSVKLDD